MIRRVCMASCTVESLGCIFCLVTEVVTVLRAPHPGVCDRYPPEEVGHAIFGPPQMKEVIW